MPEDNFRNAIGSRIDKWAHFFLQWLDLEEYQHWYDAHDCDTVKNEYPLRSATTTLRETAPFDPIDVPIHALH